MFIKLSIVVLLSSVVCGILGASVAVNVTDAEMSDKNGTLLNSTMALNASENILKAREINLLKLNVSESSNSTMNSTHLNASSLMQKRESTDEKLILDLNNSSSSDSSELEKLSLEFNSTVANSSKVDNISTRSVLVDGTDSTSNSTNNGTANPWSALPLFRDLNATLKNSSLRNSSDSSDSSQATREVQSPENSIETEAGKDLVHDKNSGNDTEKVDQLLEDSSADGLEDGTEIDGTKSTKKPCTTVSCFISRGCSDTSCSQDDN